MTAEASGNRQPEDAPACLRRDGATWTDAELKQAAIWVAEDRHLRHLLGCAKGFVYLFGLDGRLDAAEVFNTIYARVIDTKPGRNSRRFIDRYEPQKCRSMKKCPFLNWLKWLMWWEVKEEKKRRGTTESRRRQYAETDGMSGTIYGEEDFDVAHWELEHDVQQTLERLEACDREILTWHYFDSLSLKDIASVLDISYPAADTRLYRARQRFRKLYDD